MADVDNTLYDAFGQRQVSTMFTQLNQYHVVMEVGQNFQTDPQTLNNLYVKSTQRDAGSAEHAGPLGAGARAALDRPSGAVPVAPLSASTLPRARPLATR